MPQISFIITYYNLPPDMLKACVDSIISLPMKSHEREIIIIDDGSEISPMTYLGDASSEIVYIRQTNSGLSIARNRGMLEAKGEYIQFVDGDDTIITEEYKKCTEILKEQKPDMLMFCMTNNKDEHSNNWRIETSGTEYMAKHNLHSTACGYLFRKSITGNLKFTKNIYHEDDEFTPLLLLKAESLIATGYKAYWYRQRDCSITTNKNKTKVKQRLDNKRDIIFRLQDKCGSLEGSQKDALARRVAQLTMDYIYTTIIETHDSNAINNRLDQLHQKYLYPLPNGNYTAKYKWFRAISSNRAGICLLTLILPLLKRER